MAVIEKVGNLFDSDAHALGHGVNAQGLMGAGIAVEFRKRWPTMYNEYLRMCHSGELSSGGSYVYHYKPSGTYICNMVTQNFPGRNAKYEYVADSLRRTLRTLDDLAVESLAIPRIGCGIGGLEWPNVLTIIDDIGADYPDIDIEVWTLP